MPTAAEIRARQAARAAGGSPPPAASPAPTLEEQLSASLSPAVTGLGLAPQGLDPARPNVVDFSTVNRPAAAPPAVLTTTGVDVTEAPAVALREALAAEAEADPADFPGQAGSDRAEPAPPPTAEPRRGRGRPRKPRAAEAAPAAEPSPAALVERLEKIATALQAVADAADSAVQTVNAELRALGVRL